MKELIVTLLQAYYVIVLAYVVLSWVPRPPEPMEPLVRGIRAVVDPVVAPIRRVLPPLQLGGVALDLSVIVLFVALSLLTTAFSR